MGGEIQYILHVSSFEANIRLSFVGISARDARVAAEVVYHHTFLVFEQRSVDGPVSQDEFSLCTKKKKVIQPIYGEGGGSVRFSFLGGRVSDVIIIPAHQRTFVYS